MLEGRAGGCLDGARLSSESADDQSLISYFLGASIVNSEHHQANARPRMHYVRSSLRVNTRTYVPIGTFEAGKYISL